MQLSADIAAIVVAASKSLGQDAVPKSWLDLLKKGWKIWVRPDNFTGCADADYVWRDPHGLVVCCVCHATPNT
jgi:hypothetical protein